jgi:KamA family protein
MTETKFKAFNLNNFTDIPQIQEYLSEEEIKIIRVVGTVLPFKVNNYVVDKLIDWNNIPADPIFQLTFPQKGMLKEEHYQTVEKAIDAGADKAELTGIVNKIRHELNPHPAGQMKNVPMLGERRLDGMQHKYNETVLFFPSHSQTCHAYCTFCFRWPQFIGIDDLKFTMNETEALIAYLKEHPEVNDVLFTGGDPMVMSANKLKAYIEPLLEADLPNLQTIRIGTKALSYWPNRFINDKDSEDVLALFKKIRNRGKQLAIMAHLNHSNELRTEEAAEAIRNIRKTGALVRTQSPIMNHINNDAQEWVDMWNLQVRLGCIPYYMFIARDTGAQDYFAVTLEQAWKVFREAYSKISGIARTVRGPSMSAYPGKVQVLGVTEVNGEKCYALSFIQGRNHDWVVKPFFAKYDPDAVWLDDLKPLFGEKFFYEDELEKM